MNVTLRILFHPNSVSPPTYLVTSPPFPSLLTSTSFTRVTKSPPSPPHTPKKPSQPARAPIPRSSRSSAHHLPFPGPSQPTPRYQRTDRYHKNPAACIRTWLFKTLAAYPMLVIADLNQIPKTIYLTALLFSSPPSPSTCRENPLSLFEPTLPNGLAAIFSVEMFLFLFFGG